ncbi:MAG: hypothetical protein H0W25_07390, partial [Acidimicrobiia bacterium]|nr:hypothetical protein [Acidimicrobiia bacterium]
MAGAEGYAHELVGRAATLLHDDVAAAQRLYTEALELDPTIRQGWFDLALVHKWRRAWDDCLACNRNAITLAPELAGRNDPAAWDAGVAATALHDWSAARRAWRHYGLDVGGAGATPVAIDLG